MIELNDRTDWLLVGMEPDENGWLLTGKDSFQLGWLTWSAGIG